MTIRLPGVTLLATLITVAPLGIAAAQAPAVPASTAPAAAPAVPSATPAAPAPPSATSAAVEQRIRALQSQLGITSEQMPLWTAFAQAMQDNATSTEQLFQQRAGAAATMSAVENMHSYATLARSYADDTAKLSVAFDSLYASLSPTQKQAADTLFRQQASPPKKR
jgi:periplasmic protein CpxP/Spy